MGELFTEKEERRLRQGYIEWLHGSLNGYRMDEVKCCWIDIGCLLDG